MINHLKSINTLSSDMKKTKNKEEWTELLIFIKLLTEQKLQLSDKDLNPKNNFLTFKKLQLII